MLDVATYNFHYIPVLKQLNSAFLVTMINDLHIDRCYDELHDWYCKVWTTASKCS